MTKDCEFVDYPKGEDGNPATNKQFQIALGEQWKLVAKCNNRLEELRGKE